MRLTQSGTSLAGDLVQLIHPLTGKAPRDPEATRARVEGEIIEDTRIIENAFGRPRAVGEGPE